MINLMAKILDKLVHVYVSSPPCLTYSVTFTNDVTSPREMTTAIGCQRLPEYP